MPDSAPVTTPVKGTLMQGKRGLIMGVANERSLAWGIATACAAQGAELAFTFQGEALERRVRPLAASVQSDRVFACDVADEASVDTAFDALKTHGMGWTSWFTRSAMPTRPICGGVISIRRAPRSCRRWISPATRSPRWRSAPCR